MWSVNDSDAPLIAKEVYGYIFTGSGQPNPTKSAFALADAVKKLRDEKAAPFLSWVPFIHIGI
jgi:hypothetical protein